MRGFSELFGRGRPVFSFEFFLPKKPEEDSVFKATVLDLKRLDPSFVTLTYGALGSRRDRTLEMAGALRNELGLPTAAHLTCIAHTREEIVQILRRIRDLNIDNIVALRGDPPAGVEGQGEGGAVKPQGEFRHAVELVRLIRGQGYDFGLAVAGYPEGHPECPSREEDLRRLKEKVEAGADWVITQLFFDNRDYFGFVERARAIGIRAPIVPGIMPVTSYSQIRKFAQMCGAALPEPLRASLERVQEDREAVVRLGIEHATRQCRELLDRGAPGIHFYTLNKSLSTQVVLSALRKV